MEKEAKKVFRALEKHSKGKGNLKHLSKAHVIQMNMLQERDLVDDVDAEEDL